MADTATRRGRAQKIAQYTKEDAWGPEINDGAIERLDEMWGTTAVTVNGNVTLTVEQFIEDQARSVTLVLTGNGGFAVTTPPVDKPYLVINNCAADVTVKPAGGTAATIRAGTGAWYYTNAAATAGGVVDLPLDKIKAPAGPVAMGGQKLTGMGAGTAATDGATLSNRLDQFAVPNAPVAFNGQKATGLADGANASQDAATVLQVENKIASASINHPDQSGNASKFLKTNGTTPLWSKIDISNLSEVEGTVAVGQGGTGRTSLTANSLLYGAGTSPVGFIGTGTTGHVLTSNGAGSPPSFQNVQRASIIAIGSAVVASNVAAVDFTSGIDGTYHEYEIRFQNVVPATDLGIFQVRSSTDGGASFDAGASDYSHVNMYSASTAPTTVTAAGNAGAAQFVLSGVGIGSDPDENGISGMIRIFRPSEAQKVQFLWETFSLSGAPSFIQLRGGGVRLAVADVNAVRFLFHNGNIESGRFQLYGVRQEA